MNDYCTSDFSNLLKLSDLNSYEKLWQLDLEPVDTPNRERGGWSSVCRLVLVGENAQEHIFYIKRQSNHLSRSWQRPLGEPTFAREYRNIKAYENNAIAALDAVYYSEVKSAGEYQAILITRSLDNYVPMDDVLGQWSELTVSERTEYLHVIAELIGRLHKARFTHHCLYPKHIYINLSLVPSARLIDLEKTRYQWLRKRECIADLSALLRRCMIFSDSERQEFLEHYLTFNELGLSVESFVESFYRRKNDKDTRP
jgi:hypothetical protein